MEENIKRLLKAKRIQVKLGKLYMSTDANGKSQYEIEFRLIPKHK